MLLNTKAASLSFACTAAILYLLCALFVYLSPLAFLALINTWAHGIDLTEIAASRPFTATAFFTGLISIFVVSFLTGAVFSIIYNKLGGLSKT